MSLSYGVLGPIAVWVDGQLIDLGGARQRRLLAALLLARGRALSADRLSEIVWAGAPPAKSRNTLRTYIARLRRSLEATVDGPVITAAEG